jgi:hypothetical protein
MRLKEKTVVPVVRLGKVETLPKRLWAMGLMVCVVFQIVAVQFRSFGKLRHRGSNPALVSHDSHSHAE